jgi:energy-coupling factor transporter transmembrane protein EcfT
MEARCYLGGKGRSHLIRLDAQPRDYVALFIALLIVGLTINMARVDADRLILGLVTQYSIP